jgi:hypothetical protein
LRAIWQKRFASRWGKPSSSTTPPELVAPSVPPRLRAPRPHGYTLLLHHIGMPTAPILYRKLSYKTPDDFEFLELINEAPSMLTGRPPLAATNFAELGA